MASTKQREAARRNVKKAQAGARSKQTRKNLPKSTRTALGKQANAGRKRDEPPEGTHPRPALQRGAAARHRGPLGHEQAAAPARGRPQEELSRTAARRVVASHP